MPLPQGRNRHSSTKSASSAVRAIRSEPLKETERRPVETRVFSKGLSGGVPTAALNAQAEIGRELWRGSLAPFSPFSVIQTEMARWVDDFWRGAFTGRPTPGLFTRMPTAGLPLTGIAALPRADLKETANGYQAQVELPGLKRQDIDVRLDGDDLLVRGVKADSSSRRDTDYHMCERRFGQFERRIPLPRDVDREACEADFHDGVLNIVLPKKTIAARGDRRIEVR
jgi:HSP20 family protein